MRICAAALACALVAGTAAAHDGHVHDSAAAEPLPPGTSGQGLPVDLGGAFELIDQTGAPRDETEPDGRLQLVFFGYANCPGICSQALPVMAEAARRAAAAGVAVVPVLVTVDPARDTPAAMAEVLAELHPDFVGLTGDAAALGVAWDAYRVRPAVAFVDPEHGPVYEHGGFLYLLSGAGEFLTLLPPMIDPDRLAEIVSGYAGR